MKLKDAYSSQSFHNNGQAVLDLLVNYLEEINSGDIKTLPYLSPEEELAFWQNWSCTTNNESLVQLLSDVLNHCVKLHSKKYLGHQTAVVLPLAAVTSMFNQLLNNGMGVYEMGMAGNAIEKVVIDFLCKKFSLSQKSGGFITSGGSLGNLTALLAARAAKTNIWKHGHDVNYAVMISDQAHYSIERALRIMGFGDDGIIKVPTCKFALDIQLLQVSFDEARLLGKKIFCLVASAGATNTGSYDNLIAISEFCKENDIWLHVDAAHGGAVCFSQKYKGLIEGIQYADSIILDFHKLLLSPALSTAVLFNDNATSSAFEQQANYLWTPESESPWFQSGKRTFECTKHMAAVQFFAMLKIFGENIFEENVDTVYDLARQFAEAIQNEPDFELLVFPQSNIICFRLVWSDNINELNKKIHEQLITEGSYYFVSTIINDNFFLRICIMNPMTTIKELQQLLELIRSTGKKFLQSQVVVNI
jgi:L-2,4-diaminobutyrate decarboxylase